MNFRRNPAFQHLASQVTPEGVFLNRRAFVTAAGALGAGVGLSACTPENAGAAGGQLKVKPTAYTVNDPPASEQAVFSYNNFYEFGTQKDEPARYAGAMTTSPWTVTIEGEAEQTGPVALADLVDMNALEERVYRHRCVEAWSMVIPWVGVPLAGVLQRFRPKPSARFVQFETYLNPAEMRGVNAFPPPLRWPYVEGLRIDEAMNELAFLAVGAYGKMLPPQNGAPIRTVLPWKYGFKATKSIVKIRFVTDQPETAWNRANPGEYGFYSNVNPNVPHPRWPQNEERVIGGQGFNTRRVTDMYNGYGAQVASLYTDLDLVKNF
jgi:sulfoxide reductase catalytic subunit YedY